MIRITPISNILRQDPWRLKLLHSSPAVRILWLTHGQGRVLMQGRRMGTGVHNFLLVPPGAPFVLDPSAQSNGLLLETTETPPSGFASSPLLVRTRDAEQQGEIAGALDRIQREQVQHRPGMDAAQLANLELISIWCARALDAGQMPEHTPKATERLLLGFMTMVETRHASGWDMQRVAAALDVTPTHLSRTCKRHLGRTAARLLTERVLHAAMEALVDDTRPVKEISERLGFRSPGYFSRFVLAQCGKSPRELRKSAQHRTA